jgi:hypothetical protein
MPFALNELVNGGLMAPNVEGAPLVWIVPLALDREPNPLYGYPVSFIHLHERGFTVPASRFMRGLCYHYRVELHSPPMQFRRRPTSLASASVLTNTLRSLADAGLGAASILANLHHRRIIPLMERELRIFEMSDTANPMLLAHSQLLQDRLLPEYAATRARRIVSLKSVPHNHDDLFSFVMLPDAPAVSGLLPRFKFSRHVDVGMDSFRQQRMTVQAVRSDPLTPRAQSVARAAQWREKERAARAKERRLRRWECREQYSEEYRLREQQGLSPPGMPTGL